MIHFSFQQLTKNENRLSSININEIPEYSFGSIDSTIIYYDKNRKIGERNVQSLK